MVASRRTWRQIDGKLIEVTPSNNIPRDDLRFDGDFISPVDGGIIRNKRELHDHNQRHNVIQTTEGHNQDWAREDKKRKDFFLGGNPAGKEERIDAIKETLYKLGERP
jgi:hypothetical protein